MKRLYLLSPRSLVRDACAALLQGAGYHVVGADGDPDIAHAELLAQPADLLLADLRWGDTALLRLLSLLEDAPRPRVLAWRGEGETAGTRSALAAAVQVWAWVPAQASPQELLLSLQQVAEGQRQPPPWQTGEVDAPPDLAEAERLLLRETALGRGTPEIARLLGLAPRTVAERRRQLMLRLGLSDLAATVRYALHHRLVEPEG